MFVLSSRENRVCFHPSDVLLFVFLFMSTNTGEARSEPKLSSRDARTGCLRPGRRTRYKGM